MQPIRFLHIPKTAGETLSSILERVYAEYPDFYFTGDCRSDLARYRSLPDEEKRQVRLFHGHAPLTTGVEAIDAVPVVTLLREPVARVKSFCQHVSEGKSPHLVRDFPPEDFDLDAFLDSGDYELSNLQTKFLISQGDLEEIADPATGKERALNRLFHRVDAYGLTEYFEESLAGFARRFGWNIPRYKRLNRKNSRRLIRFERRHIERIIELNRIDLELYQVARERFIQVARSARGAWSWRMASLGWAATEAFIDSAALVKGKCIEPLAWLRRSVRRRFLLSR